MVIFLIIFTSCLAGMELEDYGGTMSHWEKRNARNEYMNPSLSGHMVISNLTLSLLEGAIVLPMIFSFYEFANSP